MSIFEELTDALSVKRSTVEVELPLDSETQIVFTFATLPDFPSYRKAILAAAEFGKDAEAKRPNLVAMYGDDLLADAASAASCHLLSHVLQDVRKERRSDDRWEVVEREDKPWNTRTFMRFAKRCGPAFMSFAQRVDNALNVIALEGEADAIEEAKKNSESERSLETHSSSHESADSDIPQNGAMTTGDTRAISSHSA
jgi:hypothetical protein